jgi:hypothetical protein
MAIAIHALTTRSTAIAAVDAGGERRPSPVGDDGASERAVPNSRHALLAAIATAVESLLPAADAGARAQPADGHAAKQALHGFVHALLAGLRPSADEGGHGRGFAWGRTSAATIAQRLNALVARLQAGAAAQSPAAPDAGIATATAADAASAATSATHASAATSPAAASPLLTAFRELATARGAGEADGTTGDALVALLQRIASALGGDAGALAPAAGSVVDVTA